MEKYTELKQIISIAIMRKKTPEEIEKIISDSIEDYNDCVKKVIREIRMLKLTNEQKKEVINLENFNKKDCQEDEATLKYLALSQYEMKIEETIDRVEEIINKKTEKKEKKAKINYKEIDNAITNKQDNFNFANILINSITDEIKSSKKGIQNYLCIIKFLDNQQKEICEILERFNIDVALIINNTILKKVKIEKSLSLQDSETCKEVNSLIKKYIENGQILDQSLSFQSKRTLFVESLYQGTDNIKNEEYKQPTTKDYIKDIELDEK